MPQPAWVSTMLSMSIPLWPQRAIFWFRQDNVSMSQNSNHFKLVPRTWWWVHWTPMASIVTRSHPTEHLWDAVKGEFGITDVQLTSLTLSRQYGQTFTLNLCHIELRRFRAKRGPTSYRQDVPDKVASGRTWLVLFLPFAVHKKYRSVSRNTQQLFWATFVIRA